MCMWFMPALASGFGPTWPEYYYCCIAYFTLHQHLKMFCLEAVQLSPSNIIWVLWLSPDPKYSHMQEKPSLFQWNLFICIQKKIQFFFKKPSFLKRIDKKFKSVETFYISRGNQKGREGKSKTSLSVVIWMCTQVGIYSTVVISCGHHYSKLPEVTQASRNPTEDFSLYL
jgi:hypothetical protein